MSMVDDNVFMDLDSEYGGDMIQIFMHPNEVRYFNL